MPKLRVHNFSVSLDGYGAGVGQTLDAPIGRDGGRLHEWIFATDYGRRMIGAPTTGEEGVDDRFLLAGDENVGATIMGRNMFGPVRGPWPDDSWTGWWGDEPPYHHPVFVLTHHAREPLVMDGGTTFHFVTDGVDVAVARALDAAGGKDVRVGGGVSTIQQLLAAGKIDEMHLAVVPVLLGAGERLFADGLDLSDDFACTEVVSAPSVTHLRLQRRG